MYLARAVNIVEETQENISHLDYKNDEKFGKYMNDVKVERFQ